LKISLKFHSFILALGLVIAGCAARQLSPRLDVFVFHEIKMYGGRVMISRNKEELSGKWDYSRDKFGTLIQCHGSSFETIDHFFRSFYGTPLPAGKNAEGQPQWVIPAKTAGVSIWYSKLDDGVQIDIIKPNSDWR
jgi:hypothetical protein